MFDRPTSILAAVFAVTGFLVVTAAFTGYHERRDEAPRKAELVRLIEDRREQVHELDLAVAELRQSVESAKRTASRRTAAERSADAHMAELAELAGTVAVRGPGTVVRLAPSRRAPASPQQAGAYRIHDSDVQLVVNALFAAGAEAVAVNDSRLVATTPIRAAGDTIVVNFRPLSPPFRIVAIGADRDDFEDSPIAQRFRRWKELFGLGFDVSTDDSLTVPAYTGRVGISTAEPRS